MSATVLRSQHLTSYAHIGTGWPFTVRDAKPSDNAGLVALAKACSMSGDIELRIDRAPNFFTLNQLEGERWRLAVAERDGQIVGCICTSERDCYVDGKRQRIGYIGDLKVHPAHRDSVVADALSRYAAELMAPLPETAPVLITVLAGNAPMERRLGGPRGLARFSRVATIRTHSLSILWERRNPIHWARITPASWNDIEEMARLWHDVSRHRQLAPAHDADSLARWIREAPGLDIEDFRLARSADGKLLGFVGLWDQRSFKQLTVVSYSRRMAVARRVFNAVAPLTGSERLPDSGAPLSVVTATHVCVPSERADVLRALIVSAHNELRNSGCSILNVGLDVKDPLAVGMKGLFAQPTDIHAYLADARGNAWKGELSGALHYEIALV